MSNLIRRHWFGWRQNSLVDQLLRFSNELGDFDEAAPRLLEQVTINDWVIGARAVPCLIGRPTDHPSIQNDNAVFTSELFYLDEEQRIARTFSRWYRLGRPGTACFWNEKFPAKQ